MADETRLPRSEAERIVEQFLEQTAPGYPTYTLTEDGETGWAFWIDANDTTSYLRPDGSVQWFGSAWPENVEYEGGTGQFRERETT